MRRVFYNSNLYKDQKYNTQINGAAERLYEWAGQKGINFSTDNELLALPLA